MVELFIARVRPSPKCQPSPSRRGGHTPVPSVARRELPTPAALNELAVASPNPTDGICTRFACRNRRFSTEKRSPTASPHRRGLAQGEVCPHRPYSLRKEPRHWIERRDYSEAVASSLRRKLATSGLLRRASIELGEPLSWRPARRASARGAGNTPDPYARLMRPRFLDPLSPPGDVSSPPLCPTLSRRISSGCVVRKLTTTVDRRDATARAWIAYFAVSSKLCYCLARE